MLDPRPWAPEQAAGLAAWAVQPPLRIVAVACPQPQAQGDPGAALLVQHLRAGCAALGLQCADVVGAPSVWDDVPAGDVWLWCAPTDLLLRWWPLDEGHPLVPLLAQPSAIVAAYRAVKQLHAAQLQPVVVAVAARVGEEGPLHAACQALQRTCERHLGWVPGVWVLGYHDGSAPPQGLQGNLDVVTRALEAAWTLDMWRSPQGEAKRPC
ncbi:hypothetical protein [Tepidimonas aquatica]|uniref:Uncharacterized protein n=1 Tax=Tepidimonas aquatica TaxID=247482 RepID=A0A554WP59_9BURK|nr:hypothetical protein [Tepidimonas aquatica]TSE25367.1 hypothetical protein Taqua_01111 [Tepidimonas aquatica]